MKINQYVEIVGSSNPRLNAMSKESQYEILAVLQKKYLKVNVTIVDDMTGLIALVAKKPDLVVLGMKLVLLRPEIGYDASPKVWLSDYLRERGIMFTGSDTGALALEFDKPAAKQTVLDSDLMTPAYFISPVLAPIFSHHLHFPLFVKPTNRGDSKGIDEQSLVHTQGELEAKITSIHATCSSDALVEEYLSGREFSVAVVEEGAERSLIAMPIEIIAPKDSNGNTFLTAGIKSADAETVQLVEDRVLKQALNNIACGAFRALGARDYGRIDIRLDATGRPSFIEANLMPGLSHHGYLARCFKLNKQGDYASMITKIVRLGSGRCELSTGQAMLDNSVVFPEIRVPEIVSN